MDNDRALAYKDSPRTLSDHTPLLKNGLKTFNDCKRAKNVLETALNDCEAPQIPDK